MIKPMSPQTLHDFSAFLAAFVPLLLTATALLSLRRANNKKSAQCKYSSTWTFNT
jgi:hypothetical protein